MKMAASLRVGLCILFCVACSTEGDVKLSSNLMTTAGMSVVCAGQHVNFKCSGENIVLIRWVMDPFVNSSNPVTFIPTSRAGSCHIIIASEQQQLTFCLEAVSLAQDMATASMTSTLMFDVAEGRNQKGVTLNTGTVVQCNGQRKTLLVIQGLPPPLSNLKCNGSDSFSSSSYEVMCTWSTQKYYIQSYQFSVKAMLNGKENHTNLLVVAANETMLEFTLMCPFDTIDIEAVSKDFCNSSSATTVISISGKCSGQDQSHGGQEVIALVVIPIIVVITAGILGIPIVLYRRIYHSKTESQVKWKRCQSDLPVGMAQIQTVKINNRLYCGGGNSHTIYICSICAGIRLSKWEKLSTSCPVQMFALAHFTIKGKRNLVALGGAFSGEPALAQNKIYVYPTEGESNPDWKTNTSLGNLNTPRLYPAAITYEDPKKQEYIIVCGGLDPSAKSMDVVEIFDGHTWNIVSPLPMKRSCLSLTCVDRHLFVMGGEESGKLEKNVAKIDLVNLPQVSEWNKVTSCPLAGSTAVGVGDKLLAIGGKITTQWWPLSLLWKFEDQRAVYVYDENGYKWELVGRTESKVYMAGAVQLSEIEFAVVGGQCEDNILQKSVYIGTYNIAQ